MDNTANKILEDQVDALAERAARLEADLAGLRKTLSKPGVLERLGLDEHALDPSLSTLIASGTRHRHRADRQDALTQARREKLIDRLDQADRSSKRTRRPFSEAWDKLSRE